MADRCPLNVTILHCLSTHPPLQLGQDVFDALSAAAGRGVALRIVQSQPSKSMPDDDSQALAKLYPNTVQLRSINMTHVLGGGIVHTKFWVVDSSSIFVGSANMDWRSLAQVKELGALLLSCPTVAHDLAATFESYAPRSARDAARDNL